MNPPAAKALAGDAGAVSVLIVDDSIVARAAIGRMVEATGRYTVAGAVSTVRGALDFLARRRVDIIILDLEMPGVDGLTALPELLTAGQGARILVVSATAATGAMATIQALALGAADTLEKPRGGSFASRFAEVLEERLDRLVDVAEGAPPPPRSTEPAALPPIGPFDIVLIGASTGGIHALTALLRALPPQFDRPILITQHLPATFMPYFAAQLAVIAGRPCSVAEDRMRIQPGQILIAPGDAHLSLVRTSEGAAIRLTTEAVSSGCMPSVDPMFASAAAVYGNRALGVVLSGMGRDGSVGARDLHDQGASILVQDRATSVVWGMPGAIAGGVGAVATLPPEEIGRVIGARWLKR